MNTLDSFRSASTYLTRKLTKLKTNNAGVNPAKGGFYFIMNDDELKNKLEALREAIKQATEDLPPEYAKTSLRLFAENTLGKKINLPEKLSYEEAEQRIIKIILLADSIKKAKTKRIQTVSTAIDNPTRTAFNPAKNDKAYKKSIDLLAGYTKGKNSRPINISFRIEIKRLEGVTFSDDELRLDYFTRAVYNIICSSWAAGNRFFTLQMLAEATLGRPYHSQSQNDVLLQEFKRAVESLSCNRVCLNTENEIKYLKNNVKNVIDNLVHTRGATIELNGQLVDCYEIIAEPALFEYAQSKNQVESCEIKRLALPSGVKATPENIALREYLYTEIIDMNSPNSKRNHIILFDTLFKALRLEELSRRDKSRVRDRTKLILEAFKTNGIIADYEIPEAEAGKSIEKIIITPKVINAEIVNNNQTPEINISE